MKITGTTTLAELAIERARLGITDIHIKISPRDGSRSVTVETTRSGTQVTAATEHEALAKAFEHLESRSWLNGEGEAFRRERES